MEKEKLRDFEIQATLVLLVTTTVPARSLDEAVGKSKELKESDFVDFKGDYMDGKMRITGIYESSPMA
jgi:hypothetical protein